MRKRILMAFLSFCTLSSLSQPFVSEVRSIGDRLHLVWYDRYSNKSIVAEFRDFIVLIEFPQGDSLVDELITRLGRDFPGKPIRYVMHSHHHSHSISSFDPFHRRTQAKLVTTKYNLEHVKALTTDTARLLREAIVYSGTHTIQDRTNRLVAMQVRQSEYAVPTPEYNVFHFPMQSSMVTGCLFNKPTGYYEVVNQRKRALKDFMRDRGLNPASLIPTNTSRTNGFVDICTADMLDNTLTEGLDPDRFAERFKSMDVQYLFSKSDSLKASFSLIPRSYDHIVCANYLIAGGEYLRAVSVLRPLTELYPTEAVIPGFIAQCYESMGMKTEAVAYYRRQRSLLTDTEELEEVDRKIAELSG